jgi:hypothetical protein
MTAETEIATLIQSGLFLAGLLFMAGILVLFAGASILTR